MSPSVFNRPDTLLGVCEALGQDLGVNPLWLRVAMAMGMLWNPVAMVVGYLLLGGAVALARWATPMRQDAAPTPAAEQHAPVAGNDDAAVELAEAA